MLVVWENHKTDRQTDRQTDNYKSAIFDDNFCYDIDWHRGNAFFVM